MIYTIYCNLQNSSDSHKLIHTVAIYNSVCIFVVTYVHMLQCVSVYIFTYKETYVLL